MNQFIMSFYVERLKAGWTLNEINETDILSWLDITVHQAVMDYRKKLSELDEGKY